MADDDAYVVLLLVHLHFPEAGSLKAKRKDLLKAVITLIKASSKP